MNDRLTKEEQKDLLILKTTYEMHVKEREQSALRGRTDSVERMDIVIKDTLGKMSAIDRDFAEKCVKEIQSRKNGSFRIEDAIDVGFPDKDVFDTLSMIGDNAVQNDLPSDDFNNEVIESSALYDLADKIESSESNNITDGVVTSKNEDRMYNNIDSNAQYDLIPLPSKGECYREKMDRIPVGYLTASDENLITSPNLYESGAISSVLLKKKVLNKNIDIDSLVSGDVDAIMLFLRATSYGCDFPIIAKEPRTGQKIETTVDISKLNYKSFVLKGDENGYFDFELPNTKALIKFKFLTKKDERLLKKLNKKENESIASFELGEAIEKVKNALKADTTLSSADKASIIGANEKLEKWAENMSKSSKSAPYTKSITNTMEMQIVSVNGNTNRKDIHDFVMAMPASDSLAFRRYVYDNQPGVDFGVDIAVPESMGGGSFKCFLEWDDTIFWNIA